MVKRGLKNVVKQIGWGIISLIVLSGTSKAQSTFDGQVIDSANQEPIASVTVLLKGKEITTVTNNQGYFKFTVDHVFPNDTLIFTSVGFVTFKLPVAAYETNFMIVLRSSNASLKQVNIRAEKMKSKRLNGFNLGQIVRDTAYLPTPYSTEICYAKLFIAPMNNAILSKIEIGRTGFGVLLREIINKNNPIIPLMPVTKTNPRTRFVIHILSINPQSRLPDKVLFTKPVSIEDNLSWITLDLAEDRFVLESKEFFVAVEWLRIPFNEIVKLEWAPRVRNIKKNGNKMLEDVSQYRIFYQPALASYPSTRLVPSYVKNKQGLWVPSLNDQEVALSAIVKY